MQLRRHIETKIAEDPDCEQIEVSAVDVFKHMVDCAKDNPLDCRVLGSLVLCGVIVLLHKSEINGDAEMFFAAARLLSAPFAAQHQTTYIFLVTEFFVNWHCKSDAGKKMFEEAFLFRKTRNGSNIFSDRFVEHNVFYVRMFTGKKALGPCHAEHVQQSAMLLPERLADKSGVKLEMESPGADTEDTERGRQ